MLGSENSLDLGLGKGQTESVPNYFARPLSCHFPDKNQTNPQTLLYGPHPAITQTVPQQGD